MHCKEKAPLVNQSHSKFANVLIYVSKHTCIQRQGIQRSPLAKKPETDNLPLMVIDHPETDLLLLDLLLHHPVALLLHHPVVEPHQLELVTARARGCKKVSAIFLRTIKTFAP